MSTNAPLALPSRVYDFDEPGFEPTVGNGSLTQRTNAVEYPSPVVKLLRSGCLAGSTVEGLPIAWPSADSEPPQGATPADRCEVNLTSSALGLFTLQTALPGQPWVALVPPVQVVGGTATRFVIERQQVAAGAFLRVTFQALHATSRANAWLIPALN